MRIALLLVLALPVPMAASYAQQPERDARRGGREQPLQEFELTHFVSERVTVTTRSMKSGSLECLIYRPRGDSPKDSGSEQVTDKSDKADNASNVASAKSASLPVIIWLHGLNDGFHRFHNAGGAMTLDAVRDKGEIGDVIVVVPTIARQTMYVDGEVNGDVETAVTKDLLDYVAKTTPRATKDRSQRAIMGVSMGGYAALKIAMRHPDLFGVVAAHASAILPADPEELSAQQDRMRSRMARSLGVNEVFGDPIDQKRWAEHMPMALVRDMDTKQLSRLKIYFDVGTADRYGFAQPNQDLSAALTKKEVPHTFRLVEGGGHSWGSPSMAENLAESFKFVGAAFAQKAERSSKDKAADDKTPVRDSKSEREK